MIHLPRPGDGASDSPGPAESADERAARNSHRDRSGDLLLAFWVLRELGEVVNRFGSVIALFFCAWLISFVLGPPADALVRLKVRRPLAVFAVYALAFAVVFFGCCSSSPSSPISSAGCARQVNAYTGLTPAMLSWLEERAIAFGVTESDLREFYRGALDQVRAITGQALQNAIGLLTGAASVVINLVFCLIISVYMMLDGRRIIAGMLAMLPRLYRAEARAVLQSIGDNFGGFIRGTLILSAVYAVGVALTMWLIGLEYKAVSALFAGVALIIPFVGPAISLAPALLVALLTRTGDVWWIALLLFVMQQSVLNIVGPRVYGRTVNMHPLLVIGAALTGRRRRRLLGRALRHPDGGHHRLGRQAARRWPADRGEPPPAPMANRRPGRGRDRAARGRSRDRRGRAGGD